MTPAELCVAHARTYIGTKWRHRGRKPWAIDCVGILVLSVAAGGVQMRDRRDYGREPWKDGLQRELDEHFGQPVEDMRPGDVVLIQWRDTPAPSHVGILADYAHGGLSLIHSLMRSRRVVEHRIDDAWRARIAGWHRMPGVA